MFLQRIKGVSVVYLSLGLPCISLSSVSLGSQPYQEQKVFSLSLKETLKIALEQNLDILFAEEQIREAEALTKTTRARLLPSISGDVDQRRHVRSRASLGLPEVTRESVGPDNLFDARLVLETPLLDLKSFYDFFSNQDNEQLQKVELEVARENIIAQAAAIYYQLLRDEEALRVSESDVKLRKHQVALKQDQVSSGAATDLDLSQAMHRFSDAKKDLKKAQLAVHRSVLELKRLLNIDPNADLLPTDQLLFTPVERPSLEEAIAVALEQRLDLKAQRERENIAIHQRKAAKADFFPVVDVFGHYGTSGESVDENVEIWAIGVQVNVPIWDSYKRRGSLEQNISELWQARNRTEDLKRTIHTEVSTLFHELAFREVEVKFSQESVELAEKKLQLEKDELASGNSTPLDLLELEIDLIEEKFKELDKLFDYHRTRINWFTALGSAIQLTGEEEKRVK